MSPPPIACRPATRDDLAAVMRLVAGLAAYHGDTAPDDADVFAADIFGPAPWVRILVAEQGGALVGYAGLCRLYRLHFAQRVMELHHLFVEEPQRGAGVGRALVAASLDAARALGCVTLVVGTNTDNPRAQRYYESFSFTRLRPPGPRFSIQL